MSAINYGSLLWEIDKKYGNRRAFCDEIGISAVTLSRYINGLSQMPTDVIIKSCEVLSIPKDEIGFYFFTPNVDKRKQNEDDKSGKL